jgi:hypothetical protein
MMQMLVLSILEMCLHYSTNLRFETGKMRKILRLLSRMQVYSSSLRNMVAVVLSTQHNCPVIIC